MQKGLIDVTIFSHFRGHGKVQLKLSTPTNIVETTFHVRYAETDQMGIVHHAVYAVWLEEGRSQWMRTQGASFTQFEKQGLALPVSELHIRYSQPARYDQLVKIRCWVEEVKSRKVTFEYEVVAAKTKKLLAKGYTKHICTDHAGKVTKIPDRWQQFLRSPRVAPS